MITYYFYLNNEMFNLMKYLRFYILLIVIQSICALFHATMDRSTIHSMLISNSHMIMNLCPSLRDIFLLNNANMIL
jgi:hypothetical protein